MDKFIFGIMIVLCFFVIFGWYFDSITGSFVNKDITEKKEITQLISERLCGINPDNIPDLLTIFNDTEAVRKTNGKLPNVLTLSWVPYLGLNLSLGINWCNITKEELIENYGVFILETSYILHRAVMDEKSAYGRGMIEVIDRALDGVSVDTRKALASELINIGLLRTIDNYFSTVANTLGPKFGELLFTEDLIERNVIANSLLIGVGYLR